MNSPNEVTVVTTTYSVSKNEVKLAKILRVDGGRYLFDRFQEIAEKSALFFDKGEGFFVLSSIGWTLLDILDKNPTTKFPLYLRLKETIPLADLKPLDKQ